MTAVILTIHTLIVMALIGVVLLQRSDGAALGIGGGGGGGGGFMSGRGAANALTRTTSVLAALFFATSLVLAIRAGAGESDDDVIDELTGATGNQQETQDTGNAPASAEDLLNSLGGEEQPAGDETDEPASAAELIESLGGEAPPDAAPSGAEPQQQPADQPAPANETPAEGEEPEENAPNQ
ncbi:preprotein translocase subunit SecG [Hyphococcus sp.]|uniref:preprotein translocase subunit SecG n=1 Tax=Hyphococcus sp. TaxID=2038636 RepID=UPI003CCBFDAB